MRFDHWSFYWIILLAILSVRAIPRPERFAYLLLPSYLWFAKVRLGIIDLEGFRILAFAYLISIILRGLVSRGKRFPLRALFPLLMIYVLGVSFYGTLNAPSYIPFADILVSDLQRPPYRQILQVVYWIVSMLCFFMAFRGISTADDLVRTLRIAFVSIAIVILVSIALIMSYMFVPPVGSLLSRFFSYPESAFQSGVYSRLAPFAAEPRYYGRAMSIAAALAILCAAFPLIGIPPWVRKTSVIAALILLSLLSVSVSTAAASVLGWSVLFAWLMFRGKQEPVESGGGASPVGAVQFGSEHDSTFLRAGIRSRAVRSSEEIAATNITGSPRKGRVLVYGAITLILFLIFLTRHPFFQSRIDAYLHRSGIYFGGSWAIDAGEFGWNAYIAWLSSEPRYLLLGAGLGNAAFQVYPYLSDRSPWARMGILSARLPFLDLLGNIGLIGTSMMLLLFYLWWKDLGRIAEKCPPQEYYAIQICRGMVVFLVASSLFQDTFPVIWFFLGAGFGCGSALQRATGQQTPVQTKVQTYPLASTNKTR